MENKKDYNFFSLFREQALYIWLKFAMALTPKKQQLKAKQFFFILPIKQSFCLFNENQDRQRKPYILLLP